MTFSLPLGESMPGSKSSSSGPTRNRVLSDHYRVGSRYIPQFLTQIPLQEISWTRDTLPEMLWICLLHDVHGIDDGSYLAYALAKAAFNASGQSHQRSFVLASSYSCLDCEHQDSIILDLQSEGSLEEIRRALSPLLVNYPECPMRFLIGDTDSSSSIVDGSLDDLKSCVARTMYRHERDSILIKRTAFYIASTLGNILLTSDLDLPDFEAVLDFPRTEESKEAAIVLSAMIGGVIGPDHSSNEWTEYFWNRGLKIDRCYPAGVFDESE